MLKIWNSQMKVFLVQLEKYYNSIYEYEICKLNKLIFNKVKIKMKKAHTSNSPTRLAPL